MHLSMIIWLYRVPYGYRRQMKKKDMEYQQRFKLQAILRTSTHQNDQFEKTNIKDRMVYL
jgi:hypothetical protein